MQLRILWQAETWYDVKFCWSQWKLVELSIKGTSHSPHVHVSSGKSLRLLACTVFISFGSFSYFKHAPFLSPMCLQFSFYSEFLLVLNSEYLISSYSSTIQLSLQVATVFPFFFTSFTLAFYPGNFYQCCIFATLTGITIFFFPIPFYFPLYILFSSEQGDWQVFYAKN